MVHLRFHLQTRLRTYQNNFMKSPQFRLVLVVFTLHALVVAKPLFDVLAAFPEYFVVNRIGFSEVLFLVVVVSLVLPIAIVTPLLLIQKMAKERGAQIHLIAIGTYGLGYMLQMISKIEMLPLFSAIVLGVVAGVGVAVLYWRNERFSFVISLVSPIIILFPALFLLNGNIQRAVFPANTVSKKFALEAPITIESTPPIVLVVLDEFPLTDMLDRNGDIEAGWFPNFAALANESTWYENATTVWPNTVGAVPAILSGVRPTGTKIFPNYETFPANLFSMLTNHYALNVYESTTDMVPPAQVEDDEQPSATKTPLTVVLNDAAIVYLHIISPKELTHHLPPIDQGWGNFGNAKPEQDEPIRRRRTVDEILTPNVDPERGHKAHSYTRVAKIQEFIDTIETFDEPTLHFFHTVFPHSPYYYLPSGKAHSDNQRPIGIQARKPVWKGSVAAVERLHHGLRLQEALADRFIGSLMDTLKSSEKYDESLIIITADHGMSFIHGHSFRFVTKHTFGDIAFVPLFIKYPNQSKGVRVDRNVENIDIFPTIRDVVGADSNWSFDGQSLLDENASPRATKILPDSQGKIVEMDRDEYLDAKHASIIRKIDLFSTEDERSDLFRFGRGLEFIGQPTSALAPMRVDAAIDCEGLDALKGIDLRNHFHPIRMIGKVRATRTITSDFLLAFTINGKIEVFSKPISVGDEHWFDAVLPEDAIRQGDNSVEVMLVDLGRPAPID